MHKLMAKILRHTYHSTCLVLLLACQLSAALRLSPGLVVAPARDATRLAAPRCLAPGDRVKVIEAVRARGVASTLGFKGTVVDVAEEDAENWGVCCQVDAESAVKVRLDRPTGYYEHSEVERLDRSRTGDVEEGEEVRVCKEVGAKGMPDTCGLTGTVVDVWTGCETDPACCCNELATAPITVRLHPEGTADEWWGYYAKAELVVL